MAKIDIGVEQLAKFFTDKGNNTDLRRCVDRDGVLRCSYGWYLRQGDIDANLTPTSNN